jgi:hypothetical protein
MAIFERLEAAWLDTAASAIITQCRDFPNEQFYAAAFWLLYVDYTMFGTPCFAMNSEAHLAATGGDEPEVLTRWSPPNWQFDVLSEAVEKMAPHYEALSQSLAEQPETVWDIAIEEHKDRLSRVCRSLTERARSHSAPFASIELPPDFVVGIFDEREGEPEFSRLVRASVAPEILATLPLPIWEPL